MRILLTIFLSFCSLAQAQSSLTEPAALPANTGGLIPQGPAAPNNKATSKKSSPFATAKESAEQDFKSAELALNAARAQISEESVRLSKILAEKEETLRKLQDEEKPLVSQINDSMVELTNLRNELKKRTDEDSYLFGLLAQFPTELPATIHASEYQVYKEQMDSLKSLVENASASMPEKYKGQLDMLNTGLDRVSDVLGGKKFDGIAVNDAGRLLKGTFVLLGPLCYFAAGDGSKAAGFAMSQPGSENAIIRPTSPELDAGILKLATTGEGEAPVDPSLGGALREFIEKDSLWKTFVHGGPIMWPLLFVCIAVVAVIINRIFFILWERSRRRPKDVHRLLEAAEGGDFDEAIAIGKKTTDFVARALGYALDHVETSITDALSLAGNLELKRYRWGFMVLETGVAAGPLLGLLGTVTGMMTSFKNVGGDLGAPSAITGGIAEALIATAFGIGIAVTGMVPFNYMSKMAEDAEHELEVAASRLELIVQKNHEALLRRRTLLREARSAEFAEALAEEAAKTTDVVERISPA